MDGQEESCGSFNFFSHALHDIFLSVVTKIKEICNIKPTEGENKTYSRFQDSDIGVTVQSDTVTFSRACKISKIIGHM